MRINTELAPVFSSALCGHGNGGRNLYCGGDDNEASLDKQAFLDNFDIRGSHRGIQRSFRDLKSAMRYWPDLPTSDPGSEVGNNLVLMVLRSTRFVKSHPNDVWVSNPCRAYLSDGASAKIRRLALRECALYFGLPLKVLNQLRTHEAVLRLTHPEMVHLYNMLNIKRAAIPLRSVGFVIYIY